MEGSATLMDWQSQYYKLANIYTFELILSLINYQGNANEELKQKSVYTHLLCKSDNSKYWKGCGSVISLTHS